MVTVRQIVQKMGEVFESYKGDKSSPFSGDIQRECYDNFDRIDRAAHNALPGNCLDQDMEKVRLWLAGKGAKADRSAKIWNTAVDTCDFTAAGAMALQLADILNNHGIGFPEGAIFPAVAVAASLLRYFVAHPAAMSAQRKRIESYKDWQAASRWEKFTADNPPQAHETKPACAGCGGGCACGGGCGGGCEGGCGCKAS